VTRFPNISAVGAKRRWAGLSGDGFFMQPRLNRVLSDWKSGGGINSAQSMKESRAQHERKSSVVTSRPLLAVTS
jgi:hypothetical protein